MWSFLELSHIVGIFLISLYFWGLLFCLWIYWLTMPVAYFMALLGYEGIRDKIIRRKLVRRESKRRAGTKQQASEEVSKWWSEGGVLISVAAMLRLLYGQCCAARWSSSGESVKADLGRSEVWSEVGAISRATSVSADWGCSSDSSIDFVVLQRYLLE